MAASGESSINHIPPSSPFRNEAVVRVKDSQGNFQQMVALINKGPNPTNYVSGRAVENFGWKQQDNPWADIHCPWPFVEVEFECKERSIPAPVTETFYVTGWESEYDMVISWGLQYQYLTEKVDPGFPVYPNPHQDEDKPKHHGAPQSPSMIQAAEADISQGTMSRSQPPSTENASGEAAETISSALSDVTRLRFSEDARDDFGGPAASSS